MSTEAVKTVTEVLKDYSFYGSPTYAYLLFGMGLSLSPVIWQQFLDTV